MVSFHSTRKIMIYTTPKENSPHPFHVFSDHGYDAWECSQTYMPALFKNGTNLNLFEHLAAWDEPPSNPQPATPKCHQLTRPPWNPFCFWRFTVSQTQIKPLKIHDQAQSFYSAHASDDGPSCSGEVWWKYVSSWFKWPLLLYREWSSIYFTVPRHLVE